MCNRHIPKTVYSNSCVAAQAFSAAARPGIFREFIDYHYSHYRANSAHINSGDVMASFRDYFKERSNDHEYRIFSREIMSEASRSSVQDNAELGGAMKVRAVPTIFINGRRLEGVPDARLLEQVLARDLFHD